jgi:hypothetical protein
MTDGRSRLDPQQASDVAGRHEASDGVGRPAAWDGAGRLWLEPQPALDGAGRLWLDPQQALDGAGNLAAAGRQYAAERAGIGAEIAAATAARPWGSDEFGQAFEQNYRPTEQQVLQAWEQIAAYIQGLADAAAVSVHDNLEADHQASVRVRHTHRKTS